MLTFYIFVTFFIGAYLAFHKYETYLSNKNKKFLERFGALSYMPHIPRLIDGYYYFVSGIILLELIITKSPIISSHLLIVYLLFMGTFVFKLYIIFTLQTQFTFDLMYLKNLPLILDKVYKYVRHPFYSAMIVESVLVCLIAGTTYAPFIVAAASTILFTYIVKAEEEMLGIMTDYKELTKTTGRFFPYSS